MLSLPKEIQVKIYEEYFALHRFDLVIERVGKASAPDGQKVTRLRRYPEVDRSLLLSCRDIAQNAGEAYRQTSRGYTGRLAIRCIETRSIHYLRWFMHKCQPFLEKDQLPHWVRYLTTTVVLPERFTLIHSGGEFFDRGIWKPLLELFPRMDTLDTRCISKKWMYGWAKDLDLILSETRPAMPVSIFSMMASVPINRRANFKFSQTFLCGSYAERQPDIDGNIWDPKLDELPNQYAFSGESVNVWKLRARPASEKQPETPMASPIILTDRILYNVDADSAEPESSLLFRQSPFLAWSHTMNREEEKELGEMTCKIGDAFKQQYPTTNAKSSSMPHSTVRKSTLPSKRGFRPWKVEDLSEAGLLLPERQFTYIAL